MWRATHAPFPFNLYPASPLFVNADMMDSLSFPRFFQIPASVPEYMGRIINPRRMLLFIFSLRLFWASSSFGAILWHALFCASAATASHAVPSLCSLVEALPNRIS